MTTAKTAGLLAAVILTGGLTGCAMFNKGTLNYTRTTTIGKELIDLKDAREKGALTDDEYKKVKKDILEGGPIKAEPTAVTK